jgi:hypothetical protein
MFPFVIGLSEASSHLLDHIEKSHHIENLQHIYLFVFDVINQSAAVRHIRTFGAQRGGDTAAGE